MICFESFSQVSDLRMHFVYLPKQEDVAPAAALVP